MKSSLLTLTFGLILSAILIGVASSSHAKTKVAEMKKVNLVAGTQKEIILQVADMNEKNLPEIRKNIELTGGMTFKGYCQSLHVLMYLMDTSVHADYGFLNTAFMNVSMGYVIKDGASIYQVQIACGADPNNGNPDHSGQ